MPEKIKRLSPEGYANISNTTYPRGLFYTPNEEAYIGIDNQDGYVIEHEAENIQDCMDWLRGRQR